MGLLPGRDRKVVGISPPSTTKKFKKYIGNTVGKYGGYGRSFGNSVQGRK